MPQRRDSDRKVGRTALIRAVMGASLAALVVCVQTSAARAGDDDDEDSLTTKFMKTLGLKDPRAMKDEINYSERSPLVVPPSRDLPPPMAAAAPSTPDWPKDPDVRRHLAAKAKKKEIHPANWFQESLPLRPDEIEKGRGSTPEDGKMAGQSGDSTLRQSSQDELAGKKSLFDFFKKEEYATFTGEPSRGSLTDPPAGYRTPSPDEPYGINGNGVAKTKTQNIGDRMEDAGGGH